MKTSAMSVAAVLVRFLFPLSRSLLTKNLETQHSACDTLREDIRTQTFVTLLREARSLENYGGATQEMRVLSLISWAQGCHSNSEGALA